MIKHETWWRMNGELNYPKQKLSIDADTLPGNIDHKESSA